MKKILTAMLSLAIAATQLCAIIPASADSTTQAYSVVYDIFADAKNSNSNVEFKQHDIDPTNSGTIDECAYDSDSDSFKVTASATTDNSSEATVYFAQKIDEDTGKQKEMWDLSSVRDSGSVSFAIQSSTASNIKLQLEERMAAGGYVTNNTIIDLKSAGYYTPGSEWQSVSVPLSSFSDQGKYWSNSSSSWTYPDFEFDRVIRVTFIIVSAAGTTSTVNIKDVAIKNSFAISRCEVINSDLNLYWTPYNGCAGYVVKCNEEEVGSVDASENSYTIENFEKNYINSYVVEAIDADGNVISVTPEKKHFALDNQLKAVINIGTGSSTWQTGWSKDSSVAIMDGTSSYKITATEGKFEKNSDTWDLSAARENGGYLQFWINSTDTKNVVLTLMDKQTTRGYNTNDTKVNLKDYYTPGTGWGFVSIPMTVFSDKGQYWDSTNKVSVAADFDYTNVKRLTFTNVTANTVHVQDIKIYMPYDEDLYSVQNFDIYKEGKTAEKYSAGDKLKVKATTINTTTQDNSFQIFGALYQNGKLISVTPATTCQAEANSGIYDFTFDVDVPSDSSNTTFKAFMFKNLSGIESMNVAKTAVQK